MARCFAFWMTGIALSTVWLARGPSFAEDGFSLADVDSPAARATTDDDQDAPTATVGDDQESSGVRSELIRERYPNRRVKIERQVIQDAQDNFVNHGKWKMWDEAGNLVAEGQYENGARHGTWTRWFRGGNAKLLTTVPYRQFRGPYISQARFDNDRLNGRWTIYDSKQRKISQWSFVDGQRDGTWTWWYPNGHTMRQTEYGDGDLDGQYREWKPDGTLVINEKYQEGRKLARKTTYQKGSRSQKATEGMYLYAKIIPQSADDWWNCELAKFVTEGKDERHGPWTSWYPTGQKKLQGNYDHDLQVGTFTWWHPNGQIAAEGSYDQGRQAGKWTWWHTNGQKSIQGEFANGAPTARWTWWKENGKVAQRADFSHSKGRIVKTPADTPRQPADDGAQPRTTSNSMLELPR